MQGWKLFKHALNMVLRNWLEALKIFLVPSLLAVLGAAALVFIFGVILRGGTGAQILTLSLIAALFVFVLLWTVVAWHRFVVLEEYPTGWIPPLQLNPMASYLWNAFIISLLAMAVIVLVALFFFVAQAANIVTLVAVLAIPLFIFLGVLWLQVSIVLPAAAVGNPIKISQAFDATRGAFWPFLVLLILIGLLQSGTEILVQGLEGGSEVLALVVSVVLSAFLGVLNISILTTLYGHYIEGRSID